VALALLISALAPAWSPPPSLTTRGLTVPPAVEVALVADLKVPIPLNAAVREHLTFFTEGRGRRIYARWLSNMGAWRDVMTPILEREGLPPELLYVCMIESGFNLDAVSRSAAVGPWQFVRSTGRAYSLRHDAWVDERRDPVKATRAAALHFTDLYARFGSWPLAIAAYNAGVGAIARGVELGNTNDYWRLSAAGLISPGPIKYVPKAMAAMLIGQAPERYGFGDVVPQPPVSFATVDVPGRLDLKVLARKAGVPSTALTALNPELRRAFTPPDTTDYPLRVPLAAQARLTAALDRLAKRPRRPVREHVVRFGERLYDVAVRYGTSRRALRRLNKLAVGDEPSPGSALVVPKAKPRAPTNELLVLARPAVTYAAPDRAPIYFPVRAPMDLPVVAAFFGVTPARLSMWNGLDPEATLQRGQVLRVFVPADFDRARVVTVDPARVVEVEAGSEAHHNALRYAQAQRDGSIEIVLHEVAAGENLWKIARRYDVPVQALRAQNGLGRGEVIAKGRRLSVPRRRASTPKGKAARRKPKPEARGRRRYTVRRGDSLRRIAERHGVEISDIKRRNGLKTARIYPGQELILP